MSAPRVPMVAAAVSLLAVRDAVAVDSVLMRHESLAVSGDGHPDMAHHAEHYEYTQIPDYAAHPDAAGDVLVADVVKAAASFLIRKDIEGDLAGAFKGNGKGGEIAGAFKGKGAFRGKGKGGEIMYKGGGKGKGWPDEIMNKGGGKGKGWLGEGFALTADRKARDVHSHDAASSSTAAATTLSAT